MSDEKIIEILRFLDWQLDVSNFNKICKYVDIEKMEIINDEEVLFTINSKIGKLIDKIKIYVKLEV